MRWPGATGALLAAAALSQASLAAPAGKAVAFLGEGVRERVAAEGRLRVLVGRDGEARAPAPAGLDVVRTLAGGRVLTGWITPAGLAALESDGNVRAVVVDRLVRPAGQVGTSQIGADRLLAAGLTGVGRTLGIVDTGIDLFHADFGADASGNGRIAGGWNFADGNAEVYDCDGHGTAVAGVAAGEQGIAPGASIVALKVFGVRDGCSGALASDVLAAVDWAVDRRRELGIEVLNLSLSDESVRSGFCDAEDPVAAEVFRRARAAGVAVVAASGNGGSSRGLSWPACHSDVVSVGMVYSQGQGSTEWDGTAECRDPFTGPDVVPCTSNGGPTLSLLAPGVRWSTPMAGGGRRTAFTGTSAAAPAAAAALLLARPLVPSGDPSLAVDFLRLTGKPVADVRSGISTPRLDVGSAFFAPSPFTGGCEPLPAAGNRPAALVCRTDVSSLVGEVASLAVALSVESSRLFDLRADLVAPDGTTVRLLDGRGTMGRVFREVFGRTVASAEPLSALAGRPAAGTWTLRLEGGEDEARVTSWALLVEPTAPRREERAGPPPRILPSVARAAGLHGSFFTTDVVLFNPSESEPADLALSFLPEGRAGDGAVSLSLSIPPLSTRVLADVVGNAFRTTGHGPVHLHAPGDVLVASRTETSSAGGGAYGLLAPDVGPEQAVGSRDGSVWLAPAFRPETSRVNVGIVEIGAAPATAELVLRDGGGAVRGRLALDLDGLESRQVNDVHTALGVAARPTDLLELRVLSGNGRVAGWATAVDNRSNDGSLVVASRPRRDAYLSAAARSPGARGSYFRTDLKVANPRPVPTNVRISYYPTKGPGPVQLVLGLGAWETRLFEDVLDSLLSIPEDSAGALRLTALDDSPGIVASSRTWAEAAGRGYGLAVSPLEEDSAVPGERIALTFLSSSERSRTNVGFLETSGSPATLHVTLLGTDGERLASRDLSLGPLQAVQWNDVFAEMGAAPRQDASAIVDVLRGGAVVAHAIRIDNATNDASFLPGKVLRPRPGVPGGVR